MVDTVGDAVGDAVRDAAGDAVGGAAGGANVGAILPWGIGYNSGTINLTFNMEQSIFLKPTP